ncbi:MAG: DNA polymerase I [Actinomycetes bacterium]|nr:DNA polymerase I [Actinomycetes bacterium]MDX5380871.1 DNA polymerase I [Actinomycetes bacterium]MDX5399943.1 DNA polymerase I [Actinomycetes bacterium]MDX5450620.1 DNA polymerase I [Actinomycetes bacterium]
MKERLLLVDGHSMAFRAFYALPVENFTTRSGLATNAIHGFLSMLVKLLADEEPTHVAVAFDVGRQTFRTEEYAEYKGTRDALPEDFRDQVPLIREAIRAMGLVEVSKENYEADDVIATLAREAAAAGMDVLIVSGDRDTFQLVDDAVTVLYPVRGVSTLTRMTPDAVEEKYGVRPIRYPELAALVGESSDNLSGVPGVGPKTAAKWLGQYGGLDGLIAAVDAVPGKAGESLRAHLADVVRNRRLNHLLTDLDLPVRAHDLHRGPGDRKASEDLFTSLEFSVLRDRVFGVLPGGGDAGPAVEAVERHETDDVAGFLAAARGVVAVDVVGNRSDAWRVSLADAAGAASVDLTGEGDDVAAVRAWLASPAPKSLHDAKAAWHGLRGRGIALDGVTFDTALAAYLCSPGQRNYDLPDLVSRHLGRELAASQADGMLDLAERAESLARAGAVFDLTSRLAEDLRERGAGSLLTDLELPVQRTLEDMEATGIAVDEPFLRGLEEDFASRVMAAARDAYAVIGREVNLSSPKQLQEVLFDQLGMPRTKRTKTGWTTDADSLTELFARTGHEFLRHLLVHRDQNKLRQTVETLRRSVGPDGRIHTTFAQTVAATGRLSSLDPNLQNIPVRTDEGLRIREAFVVTDGFDCLLTADYSQIEMRIMAHLSGDTGLIEAFRAGEDLHRFVGSRVFGVPAGEVTPAMRSKVKAMSYGLAYGLSAYGLSRQLAVDVAEARTLMDGYFERFGGVRDYLTSVVETARRTGYTETIMGRRRYLPDLNSDNRQRRELAERTALNAPIQGSAADIIKVAMVRLDERLSAESLATRVLLQVHDELVLEVAPGEREAATAAVRDAMAGAADLAVPLDVSVGTGRTWRDAAH